MLEQQVNLKNSLQENRKLDLCQHRLLTPVSTSIAQNENKTKKVILKIKNSFASFIATIDEDIAKADRIQKNIDEEKQKVLRLQVHTGGFYRFM
jgi:hypothetical protein